MAKSSKSAKSERQKLIDDAMKKQRGAEKRRGFAIVGVCILVAALIVGAAAWRPVMDWWDLRQYNDLELADIGAPASACQEIVTHDAEGVSDHVPFGQSVTYTDAPPAFGPHWNEAGVAPAPFADKFYDDSDRPELESLVHNLEHGYTILWYDETIAADDDQMTEIQALAKKFKADDDNFRLKFIAAPWTSADDDKVELAKDSKSFPEGQHIAFTHWKGDAEKSTGVWQYCSELSGEAVRDFMDEYPYTDSPEPNAI
ncbi:DUF3105 domain-containing protein [Nocardioides sp. R-C-SC26]|uniref:DUF3105 domain-containing protein n=1 Tax=Nocardioides sp. R-C-SC26 TaxID=2870414 RepID=UPI001E6490E9|nr:DUF3105 domain-containing protein [Nocardioides sp. R-C-SC26]